MPDKENSKFPEILIKKWGNVALRDGYTSLPTVLFRYFYLLHDPPLKPAVQATLLQLLSYWWTADGRARAISKATLAASMGINERQVQRYLKVLVESGLVERHYPPGPGRRPYAYTFDGLKRKLVAIAEPLEALKRRQPYDRQKAVEEGIAKKIQTNF